MTPIAGSAPDLLVDTSVAVPLVVVDHAHHASVADAVGERVLGLAGHAAFETFSVLTRLPGAARRSPAVVAELLAATFPGSRFLSAEAAADLLPSLAARQIGGGAVYDALIAAVAAEHRVVLATRDRRALGTYRSLGVDVELLGDG
ncbi:MAG: type II toxin-antitoxin system VapC family toxin [Ilumatobacteraceae bacterium]